MDRYFAGLALYGDDLEGAELEAWYADEKEAYAELGAKDAERYAYFYHRLNWLHGFRHLPARDYDHALGFGSAYGDEFELLAGRLKRLTILEPSDAFVREDVHGIPATYVKPSLDGTLPFADDAFDLITCLDVLHHIPNVSYVLPELCRCLQPGGFALIREPVISMGDWRRPRPGLTKRERGIPLPLFKQWLAEVGFTIRAENMWLFPPVPKLWKLLGQPPYNSVVATRLDAIFSKLLAWNLRYHATARWKKLRPTCVFFVLTKSRRPA